MLSALKHDPIIDRSKGLVPPVAQPLAHAAALGKSPFEALAAIVVGLGFDHFLYAVTAREHRMRQTQSRVWTNLPPPWLELYDQRAYIEIDPGLNAAWDSVLPVVWNQETFSGMPRAHEFFATAARYGVRSGISLALRGRPDAPGIFTLTSSIAEISGKRGRQVAGSLGQVMALAMYLNDYLPAVQNASTTPAPHAGRPLSSRERQCLQLAARGRASREIAAELGIGERVVEFHFASLFSKLGAANRHEALAKASEAGAF
jgi:DNA-binding CsgD family transcriptional regulator